MRWVILLFFLFTTAGCCRRIYPTATETRDSVWVHDTTVFRDTIIKAPGAQVALNVDSFASLPAGFSTQKTERQATVTVVKNRDGSLTAGCNCDTLAIEAQLKDNYHQQVAVRTEKQTIVQEVKYVPWWVKVLAWAGGIALAGIGGGIAFKFLKK